MKRLPPLLLLGMIGYACPTPKAGDDRLPIDGSVADLGVSRPDGGSAIPDSGEDPDSGSTMPDAETLDAETRDAETPDGGDPEDSGTPECVPTGPEVCDNGIDDDCANGIDCADPACGACVEVPSGFTLGVVVEATASCPAGFEAEETPLFAGLDPGAGCLGTCACQANPTVCLGELYIYATQTQCQNDVNLTGGQLYAGLIGAQCTSMPVQEGFPGGFRLGNWTVQQSCAASGTASPSPYSWSQQMKLCAPQLGLYGCDATSACVPSVSLAETCLITPGGASCPAPFSERATEWFTGVSDTRSCGACECGASGGGCQFARVSLGSDWSCTDDMHVSQQTPTTCTSNYSPPARVTGFPTDPTCTPSSQQSGTIEATGQQTLCCQP